MNMNMQATPMLSDNKTTTTSVLHVQRISCKDVKCFNFFQKPSFYAVAALSTSPDQKQKTPADSVGGSNPEWKDTFRFDLSSIPAATNRGEVFLQFELFAETALFSDRLSGRVFVPLDDLLAGSSLDQYSFQTVMYQIQYPDGRPNGVLSFSFKASSSSPPPPRLPVTESPPQFTTLNQYYPPANIYPAVENYEPLNVYPPISPSNYETGYLYPPPASMQYYPPPPAPAPELACLDRYDHGRFVPHENRSLYPPVW